MKRRDLLAASAVLLAGVPLIAPGDPPAAATGARAFDFATLKGEARALAARVFSAEPSVTLPALDRVDWDHYQLIRFRPERALWADLQLAFRIEFFHLGLHYRQPVRMHVIDDGVVRDLAYDPAMFDLRKAGLEAQLPAGLGFAGFRIHFHTDFSRDVAAFLGASYFRAVGAELQYGLSARGLAIDCGLDRPEEFPRFTDFWFERPRPGTDTLTLYALVDSPSAAGAFRFDITPGTVQVMRIDAAIYPRRAIERLGIAPLTSMFVCAPYDRRVADDWRPAIHDSDGLALWTGAGERIWRPLANPAAVRFNAFHDDVPRGFGLLQRDRNFDHYQDDGVFYDRRPSLWVEPLAGFGNGAVELLEIPTGEEIADNIVAFWNPSGSAQPGRELLFAYRLHWGARPAPAQPELARATMTWSGIGGVVGGPRDRTSRRFVIDFAGDGLDRIAANSGVEAVVSATHGTTELISARPLASIQGYRAMFDLRPDATAGQTDLRVYLRRGDRALSETWLYQWTPAPRARP